MGKIKVSINRKAHYVSGIDEENDRVIYTTKESEGCDYGSDFFTRSQIEYLKFYFSDKQPELKNARAIY